MLKQSHYKVGCDAHKHYSLFAVLDGHGNLLDQSRINHEPSSIRAFPSQFPPGTPVALESVGNWYWIVDEIACPGGLRPGKPLVVSPEWPTLSTPRR